MKNRFAITSIVAALAIGAVAFATGAVGGTSDPQAPAVQKGGLGTNITAQYFARGTNRILTLDQAAPTDGMQVYVIAANQELLVRQMTVGNGRFSTATAEKGGVTIELIGEGSAPGVSLYYPFADFNAQQFDFSPPMVLKAGDRVSMTFQSVGGTPGYLQVAFHGEKVQTASGLALN